MQLSSETLKKNWQALFPGIMVAGIVAITAQFLSDHYATPAMLWALLLGIAVSFLGEEGRTVKGINFSARILLRIGVAFLGVRVSASLIAGLGVKYIMLVLAGVVLTIAFGLAVSRLFGHRWRFALLTSGSVAICGASAAMAISAILPRDERSEERLIFTVVGVTVLSTITMIAYPILVRVLALNDVEAGVFIGGAIHDVAQVIGAGFSLSDQAGESAILVKLFRVAMLAPVILIASVSIQHYTKTDRSDSRTPLLPGFVIGFVVLAIASSLGLIPTWLADLVGNSSRWLLLVAIAAVGMKTNLKQVLSVGGPAIALLVTETVFLACVMLAGIKILG